MVDCLPATYKGFIHSKQNNDKEEEEEEIKKITVQSQPMQKS
jgi:hypothetical protein